MGTSFASGTECPGSRARERCGLIKRIFAPAAALLLLAGSRTAAETGPQDRIVGRELVYVVRPGDSLTVIGARFGVDAGRLARSNGLTPTARLPIGRTLRVDNRHVVPDVVGEGIVINVPQRLLFFFRDGKLAAWYPVALGRRDWQTPTGLFEVASKRSKPTWHVPPSIQRELRQQGKPVQIEVAPGPNNPLGDYWIGLSASFCGIHGTNAPASIYSFRTHGCVRLHPDDIADLFPRVSIGTPVEVVYEPVLAARQTDGSIFLEVNPDVYGRTGSLRAAFDALATRLQILELVDPARVDAALEAREGRASRIDRLP
jgi:L,D-transpeptidase ErfK/SrfK